MYELQTQHSDLYKPALKRGGKEIFGIIIQMLKFK